MRVHVISSDLDGAELRREKHKTPMHTRVTGTHDEAVLMEADQRAGKGQTWTLPEGAWDRIFKE